MDQKDDSTSQGVFLNIYDLTPYNKYLGCLGLGAYHCGVEYLGEEWSYGYIDPGSGVFRCIPKCKFSTPGTFREQLYMGDICMEPEVFHKTIQDLEPQYMGPDYDLIENNCNDFCEELLGKLGLGFPSEYNRLRSLGRWCRCFIPTEFFPKPTEETSLLGAKNQNSNSSTIQVPVDGDASVNAN